MEIEVLKQEFSVCKVNDIDTSLLTISFCFYARTDEEISLVCDSSHVPADAYACEEGWRAFRFVGTLDLSLIGILAAVSGILADNGISIFAVSTFNTDYILVKEESLEKALSVLAAAGYSIIQK
jgi:hypothetical protein